MSLEKKEIYLRLLLIKLLKKLALKEQLLCSTMRNGKGLFLFMYWQNSEKTIRMIQHILF